VSTHIEAEPSDGDRWAEIRRLRAYETAALVALEEARAGLRALGAEEEAAPSVDAAPRLLEAEEAARYVGCHRNTIYEAAKSGALTARRAGRLVRFTVADLDAWTRGAA
jgi:excisionase family DNA binding protein